MSPRITISWLINFSCNYRCPYCVLEPCREGSAKRDRLFSTGQILDAWTKFRDRYGEAFIYISGGEPTIYPDFFTMLKELSQLHRLALNTNLSVPVNSVIDNLDPSRVSLSVSFHPFFAKMTEMADKLVALSEKKFDFDVSCVAWPPLIRKLDDYHSYFQNYKFKVIPFRGAYDGKIYPESYTEEEKRSVDKYIADRCGTKFSVAPPMVSGRLCRAGQVFANIMPDGEVLRCGSGHERIYKNFFDGDFLFLDKPAPCVAEHCECLDWVVCE